MTNAVDNEQQAQETYEPALEDITITIRGGELGLGGPWTNHETTTVTPSADEPGHWRAVQQPMPETTDMTGGHSRHRKSSRHRRPGGRPAAVEVAYGTTSDLLRWLRDAEAFNLRAAARPDIETVEQLGSIAITLREGLLVNIDYHIAEEAAGKGLTRAQAIAELLHVV